jgi:hypothetical protein
MQQSCLFLSERIRNAFWRLQTAVVAKRPLYATPDDMLISMVIDSPFHWKFHRASYSDGVVHAREKTAQALSPSQWRQRFHFRHGECVSAHLYASTAGWERGFLNRTKVAND